jgi:hypothetical protein
MAKRGGLLRVDKRKDLYIAKFYDDFACYGPTGRSMHQSAAVTFLLSFGPSGLTESMSI